MNATIDIGELLYDNNIRTEEIVWLAANLDRPCDTFTDFLADHSAKELTKLFGIKITEQELKDTWAGREDLLTRFSRENLTGFLVRAETPMPHNFSDSGYSFSWGECACKWFYTDAIDETFALKLVEWKNEIVEEAKRDEKPSGV